MGMDGVVELLLSMEFLLGMYLNLFWRPGNTMDEIILIAHTSDAIIMVLIMCAVLFFSIYYQTGKKLVILGSFTLVSIILAGIMGAIFVDYGHSKVASYLMAVFFLMAFGFIGYQSLAARKLREKL